MRALKNWLLLALAPRPAAWVVRALHRSLAVRFVGRERLEAMKARGEQYVMAFWHGHLLLMVYAYVGKKLTFLVSYHPDGELVTRVMRHFGMNPTRGSSTRGGRRALHTLVKKAREGFDIAFTPDGPKGPAREAQLGVVQAARLAGLPIVPVAMAALKKKHFAPGTAS